MTTTPTASPRPHPTIIQGGMGVAVSSWRLASAVARTGQLGVVSGTALDLVLARRLQDGDPDGHLRRALAAFPVPAIAQRVLETYHEPGGRPEGTPYGPVPKLSLRQNRNAQELMVVGAFVEVWLAKEGHDGPVGINLLEKVQMATPATVYGAMLAGADYVLVGAGLPRELPRLLNRLAQHGAVSLPVDVDGAPAGSYTVDLDPNDLLGTRLPPLNRPTFLAIISADVLAGYLARDEHIRPDGFVVEGPLAGGHNAPPRGRLTLDESGQPVFGPRDEANIAKIAAIGLPFWLAGHQGSPEALIAAQAAGAVGIQVGTVFALSEDSDLTAELRSELMAGLRAGTLEVRTDARVSPTGFPFKVAQIPGTLSEPAEAEARPRLCDLGYLRTPYVRDGGSIGYRCSAEPVHVALRKGTTVEETAGRGCLCNSLTANVGLGQVRGDGYVEQPLVTLGADLDGAHRLVELYPDGWTAIQALDWLLSAKVAQA